MRMSRGWFRLVSRALGAVAMSLGLGAGLAQAARTPTASELMDWGETTDVLNCTKFWLKSEFRRKPITYKS